MPDCNIIIIVVKHEEIQKIQAIYVYINFPIEQYKTMLQNANELK